MSRILEKLSRDKLKHASGKGLLDLSPLSKEEFDLFVRDNKESGLVAAIRHRLLTRTDIEAHEAAPWANKARSLEILDGILAKLKAQRT